MAAGLSVRAHMADSLLSLGSVERRRVAEQLHAELSELRDAVAQDAEETLTRWRPRIWRTSYLPSALNLAGYLALRRHDLRRLQLALMPVGLSSLGRCEARVVENLDAVLAALAAVAALEVPDQVDLQSFFRGHELLQAQSDAVLGPPPQERSVRIMVTMSKAEADDAALVSDLLAAGMNVARINCAHDDPEIWSAITGNVRAAGRELGRPCRICFDLEGPRARIRSTTLGRRERVRRGDEVLMTAAPVPVASEWQAQFQCSLSDALDDLAIGAAVQIDEGRLGAHVVKRLPNGLVLRIDSAPEQGAHLRIEKGLNFPSSELRVDSLTAKDLADLEAVVHLGDLIGLSFVQRAGDIARLQEVLAAQSSRSPGLIVKVETEQAVRNLPELIVQGAGRQPLGVIDRPGRSCGRDRPSQAGRDTGRAAVAMRGRSRPRDLGHPGPGQPGQEGDPPPWRDDRCRHGRARGMRDAQQGAARGGGGAAARPAAIANGGSSVQEDLADASATRLG